MGLVIDIHCHLVVRDRKSPDAYVSPRQMNRLGTRLLRWCLPRGQRAPGEDFDTWFERFQVEQLTTFRRVNRVVLLAMDAVHDDTGRPRGPARRRRDFGTDLYVSNEFVRDMCRRHPDRLLFGASIHPYRGNALALLDDVAAAGAVLVKWLPVVQNIDARDPRTVAYLRRCAELCMPLLVHYGPEFTLGTSRPDAADPAPMLETLRSLRRQLVMPTVIVAHLATPLLWPFTPAVHFHTLVEALTGEFADAPLYADIAALASPSKAHWLAKILDMPALWPKLVHGSDFPIPAVPRMFRRRLGTSYAAVITEENWIDRDYVLKRSLGLPDQVFTRAGDLLRVPRPGTPEK